MANQSNGKWMIRGALLGALVVSGAALSTASAQVVKNGDAMTSTEVEALLKGKGYRKVDDVEFKDGLWQAEAKSGDGKHVRLRVDPVSGRIYSGTQASPMSKQDVRAALAANGYSKVHDLEFEDGLWKAKAEQASGQDVAVHVDPSDGLVVSAQND